MRTSGDYSSRAAIDLQIANFEQSCKKGLVPKCHLDPSWSPGSKNVDTDWCRTENQKRAVNEEARQGKFHDSSVRKYKLPAALNAETELLWLGSAMAKKMQKKECKEWRAPENSAITEKRENEEQKKKEETAEKRKEERKEKSVPRQKNSQDGQA